MRSARLPTGLVSRTSVAVFAMITVMLLAGDYAYYRRLAEETHDEKYQTIAAIGELKSAQIQQWRSERVADVSVIASSPFVIRAVEELSRDLASPLSRTHLQKFLGARASAYGYSDALLIAPNGDILVHAKDARASVGAATQQAIAAALSGGDAGLSDFYRRSDGIVHIDAVAAVRDAAGQLLGVAVLRSNAEAYLYPLIQSWPTPSRSAETLIIQREGDEVVFLNELRHRSGTALTLRAPLNQTGIPVAKAALDQHVRFEGKDYRNVEVLADLRPIPGSPWLIVTKVDADEILAEARYRAIVIGVIVGLFILLAAAAIAYVHRQRQAVLLRELYESERQQREAQHAAQQAIRESEQSLRDSVERFQQATRATFNVIWDYDIQANAVWWNDNIHTLFGYHANEIDRDEYWSDCVHPEDLERLRHGFNAAVESGREFWRDEYRFRRKDGSYAVVEDRGNITRDADGRAIRMIGAMRDITQQRSDEDSLRVQAHILDSVGQAVIATDIEGIIIYANRFAGELYGWSSTEMLGREVMEVVVSESTHEQAEPTLARLRQGESWSGEFTLRRRDGSSFPALVTESPLFDKNGIVAGVIAVSTDLTERKRLESQVMQAQRMETVGKLAGGVAHDFNNLLTVINGTADLASAKLENGDPFRADFQQIKLAGERAATLTRKLLAFGRKQIMKREILDLNAVIADWRAMLQRLIGENIDLVVVPGTGSCSVFADPGQIEQVMLNLVVNARDAMPHGGTLTIETREIELGANAGEHHPSASPGPHVMLAVSDTGIGMDEATRVRMFEPFFTTKEPGKGTGLGLATVYGVVQQSEGSVFVESEPGRGTTITIYLPRLGTGADRNLPAGPPAVARGTETLLIVENEDSSYRLAENILKAAGYTVLAADNAAEALQMLERNAGDVQMMLVDVVLRGTSGRDLATCVAAAYPEIKILYTSDQADDATLRLRERDGTTRLVGTPRTMAELTRTVREVLDTPVGHATTG